MIGVIAGSIQRLAVILGLKTSAKTSGTVIIAGVKAYLTIVLKESVKTALKFAAKSIVVVAGALSIVDGAAIILGLWDPGGWEMTIDKGMIESTRDAYYRSYLKYYDNKALFS